jgi:TetR/AcrR family transcriptional repressor of nem operon
MPRPRKFDEDSIMEELSRATGLGKQSIYNTFGGKRDLFLRALDRSTSTHVDRLTVELSSVTSSPLERIGAHLDALALTFTSEGPRDSLFTKATVELADRDPEVAEAARRAYRRLEDEYAGCIEQAQEAGEVDAALDAQALATYFVAVTRGMEVLGTAGANLATLLSVGRAALTLLT